MNGSGFEHLSKTRQLFWNLNGPPSHLTKLVWIVLYTHKFLMHKSSNANGSFGYQTGIKMFKNMMAPIFYPQDLDQIVKTGPQNVQFSNVFGI